MALTYMESLEAQGIPVLNGSQAFRFELNKALQARVLAGAGILVPKTVAFNTTEALRAYAPKMEFPRHLETKPGRQRRADVQGALV